MALRFGWASDDFAALLAKHKTSKGVIILYADDETFDVARLKQFVEEGRQRIANAAGIDAKRISIKFGGYRSSVETEFWFVPAKGKAPVATPEERPVEEPEQPDGSQAHDH